MAALQSGLYGVLWKADGVETAGMEFDLEEDSGYVYRYASPQLTEKESEGKLIRYYKVSPDEVSPHAVYSFVMDNQWCPLSFYENKNFQKDGLTDRKLEKAREEIQRKEICRGLLHARQLLVNRAFLQNSKVFIQWYKAYGTKEYDSFCRLLGRFFLCSSENRCPVKRLLTKIQIGLPGNSSVRSM